MEQRSGDRVRLARVTRAASLAILLGALVPAAPAHAVSFDLVYDDVEDGVIDTGSIIGTGTVSYDGPAMAGSFSLASLSGFSFQATFVGSTFTNADLQTDLSLSGISVFALDGGGFGLVFTGGGGTYGGSLDLIGLFSHEPTPSIGDGVGCCGGDGMVNRYKLLLSPFAEGDYSATAIPEPHTAALLAVGLLALAGARRRELRRP
jgi:hypothetical protein